MSNTPNQVDPKIKKALSKKYEIDKVIGSGGMAIVYRAVQKTLDREVALKVVHQNFVHDQEFITRFTKEAKVVAKLNHPNIITIHDVDSVGQYHYMTMEYLSGKPLSDLIRQKGQLGIGETLKITVAVAKALHYLHNKGFIHRDVKSSNIFVCDDGRAVLMDFGIVYTSESMLSQPGTVLGTPEFMSPEQANGRDLTGKSDLYSLGVIMYECLTAKMPFRTDNPLTTVYKVINEAPKSLKEHNPKVPDWLNSQVLNLLSKDPNDRVATAKEFALNIVNKKEVQYNFEGLKISEEDVSKAPQGATVRMDTTGNPGAAAAGGDFIVPPKEKSNGKIISIGAYVIAAIFLAMAGWSFFGLDIKNPSSQSVSSSSVAPKLIENDSIIYRKVAQHPYFPGGMSAYRSFITEKIKERGENFTSGTVYLKVVVGINGEVTNPEIIAGVNERQDAIAQSIIEEIDSMVPGVLSGQIVPVEMVLPVTF